MCKISFLQPNLIVSLCYTVNILWKRDSWGVIPSVRFGEIFTTNTYLYFASNIWVPSFARCRLTNDGRKTKRFSHFEKWMLLDLVPIFDFVWIVSCSWSNPTTLLLIFVAKKVPLLLVISLTVYGHVQWEPFSNNTTGYIIDLMPSLYLDQWSHHDSS